MKAVRLEERLIDEVIEYLKMHGHYRHGMSNAALVRTALSVLIYQTPNIKDGRDRAADILARTSHAPLSTVRGRVAQFAKTYNWEPKQDIHVPDKVKKTIEEASAKVEDDLSITVKECQVRDVPSGSPPAETFPDSPPWTLMKTIPIEEVVLTYPLHPLVKWANTNELKLRAVECAFGNVPKSLHKDQKTIDMARELYNYFKRWNLEKNS